MRTTAASICLGLQQALLLPFLALYAVNVLGLSPSGTGWFLVAFHGSGILLGTVISALADRTGHTLGIFRLVTAGAAGGFVALTLVDDLATVVTVAIGLLGPSSAQNGLYFSHLRRSAVDGSVMLSNRGLFSMAWVLGPLSGALLVQVAGYPGLFSALASVNLAVILLTRNMKDACPPRSARASRDTAPPPTLVAVAFLVLIFLSSTNVIATTITPLVVVNELGAGVLASGAVFGVCAAAEAGLFVAMARWGTDRDPVTVILAGAVLGGIYYCVLAAADNWIVIVAAQVFNAAFIVASVGAGLVWLQDLMPRSGGLATMLSLNSARVASLATAPLIGSLSATFGAYQPIALTAALLLIVPVALLIFVRSRVRES